MLSVTNHPVHIFDTVGNQSPSAFIPFCEFGGRMEAMEKLESLNGSKIPICNSFKAEIFNDQLCYGVDLKRYKNVNNPEKDLELGLVFLLDYNEDRQFASHKKSDNANNKSLVTTVDESHNNKEAFIYLNTIGIKVKDFYSTIQH